MALSLTATANPGSVPPSVLITLAGATSPTTLTRQAADGSRSVVRTADGLPVPVGTTSVVDYGAPFGEQLTYIGNGTTASNPVVLNVPDPWLVHPGRPGQSMPISVAEFGPRNAAPAQGMFRVIGRRNPIVVTDGQPGTLQSSVTVRTRTLAELGKLRALLSDAAPLLLNVPATLGWGVEAEYISVTSVEEARLMDYAGRPDRYLTLAYVVVDAPAGGWGGGGTGGGDGGTGTRTWADLALEAGTWAEAGALYATWADAATGNRI